MDRCLLLCLFLSFAIGCGSSPPKAELVPLEQVPAEVLKKAKEALPEVSFDTAVRRSDGGLEVRGKDSHGKVRDVEFSAAGDVIEIE